MKLLTIIYVFLFTALSAEEVLAQEFSSVNISNTKTEINLPPLEVVIDSVIKQSAILQFRNQEILAKEYGVESERKGWTKNFGVQADTRYGNVANIVANNVDGQTSTIYSRTANTQFNYGVGFYLKFPIFEGINRKNQIKVAKIELEEAKSMAKVQENEIRQVVIKMYQDLLLKQRLLDLKSQNISNAKVNMEMVEKEFRNGVTPMVEYIRLSDMTSKIEAEYEIAKSNLLLAKKLLEDMAGFKFGLITQ